MRRVLVPFMILLGLGAIALQAADFWQKKKYVEWSPKEVQRMLRDSPWARPVEIRMDSGASMAGRGGGRGGGRRGGSGGGGMSDMTAGGMGDDTPRAGTDMERMSQSVPSVVLTVRCHTALPLKQALARMRYGDEAATSPEAAKMLSRQETHYVFGVAGLPRQILRGKPEEMKEKVFLKVKGKAPIQPEAVKGDMDQGRVNLYLFFPRKDNVILLEDGEFELQVKLPSQDLKRTFKLKDMLFDGKLEI